MLTEFILYTLVATAATVAPVYKFKNILIKFFRLPFFGWGISLLYGFGASWVLLNLFSFQSSVAGLSNLTASMLFSVWLWLESLRLDPKSKRGRGRFV